MPAKLKDVAGRERGVLGDYCFACFAASFNCLRRAVSLRMKEYSCLYLWRMRLALALASLAEKSLDDIQVTQLRMLVRRVGDFSMDMMSLAVQAGTRSRS